MVRYMMDSVDCTNFRDSVLVPGMGVQPVDFRAGYVGGSYAQSSTRCGNTNVLIDVDGTHPFADVLDIETGDATPDTAPGWVVAHNKVSNFPAILYCNRSVIHAVANACDAAGLVVGKDFYWWIATLDGTKTVPDMTGVVAVQVWGSNAFNLNIDLSIVYEDSWKGTDMPVSDADAQKIAQALLNTKLDVPTAQGTINQQPFYRLVMDIWAALFYGHPNTQFGPAAVTELSEIVAAVQAASKGDATAIAENLLKNPAFVAAIQNWKPTYGG